MTQKRESQKAFEYRDEKMGGNVEEDKEEKHKEEKGEDKKDKGSKDECEQNDKKEKKKKKKEKNPEDKKDPVKLRQKLEKIDGKIQALMAKKEEIMKLINDAGHDASNTPAPSS
ncbi:hypothetical protein MLD38_039472 [Melastoma candidum]|uniref:Uncharacterized protein n=1 Tax=Melastoma candidum TaxID=119954 RepID=A0ACB9L2W2_9MYRT|nr:hypothetical protein MLD38_039472 [Melastoma candidum]